MALHSSKITVFILTTCFCIISISAQASEPDHFQKYVYPKDGFEVSFPSKPLKLRAENKGDPGYSNTYQAVVVNPISQYSVFVQHSRDRVFSDESIGAYFYGLVRGLMLTAVNPELKYSRQTRFLSFPAIEYQFTETIEGNPVLVRGIALMVDGNHIRLSQIYTGDDLNADKNFNKFVSSFRLTPIDGPLSTHRFEDKSRDIVFSPPEGWQQDTTEYAQIPAIFANPAGHIVQIIDSGATGYTCDNYKHELQTQGIQSSGVIESHGRSLTWMKSAVYNPRTKNRMIGIHYCLNTSRGALILNGLAPEKTFFRSELIFAKVAKSIVARK